MTTKKPTVKDWRNREITDWTVTTFRAYLVEEHERRYGIPYVARNYAIEGRWLKLMIVEYGPEVVKRFIDACFDEYKPTPQYPGINFGFMFSYMRARVLPRVLAEYTQQREQAQIDIEEVVDWL